MGAESLVLNTSDHLSCAVRNHRRRDGQDYSDMFSNWREDCHSGKAGARLADHISLPTPADPQSPSPESVAAPSSHSLGGCGQGDHLPPGEGSPSLDLGPFPKARTSNGSGQCVPRKANFQGYHLPTDFGWDVKGRRR